MSQPLQRPIRGALWLAIVTALIAATDAVLAILARYQFAGSADIYGWAIVEDPPYNGTRQRLVYCLAIAVLVATAAATAATLIHRPHPGARLAVLYSLPGCALLNFFTMIYSPSNIGSASKGETAAAHAESAAAFDHLFPFWSTAGHALAVVLMAALTARLLFVLRKPDVRDYFEYSPPNQIRPR